MLNVLGPDYLEFFSSHKNSSYFFIFKKYSHFLTFLGLLGYGCVSMGTVIHEMLHSSGFWHEQSRPDRDDHVRILWSNILTGMEDNFARYSRAEVSTLSLPYDTASVMHYSSRAFSRNGQLTISPIK